eukprot:3484619-Prymnesium_polylepis.1
MAAQPGERCVPAHPPGARRPAAAETKAADDGRRLVRDRRVQLRLPRACAVRPHAGALKRL